MCLVPTSQHDLNVLSKFVYVEGDPAATADSEEVLIQTSEKESSAHSSGWVGFAPSSYAAPDVSFFPPFHLLLLHVGRILSTKEACLRVLVPT